MTMITIQKLPSLEPEMRGALRKHIMRERQRLKQEMEQDAIEKRLKKEREQKRLQDAMTLDQIKEQLSTLEKRLETLKSEKHDLFVQLKQVLNEGSSKRKQSSTVPATTSSTTSTSPISTEQLKKAKLDDECGANIPLVNMTTVTNNTTNTATSTATPIDSGLTNSKTTSTIFNNNQPVKTNRFLSAIEKPQELTRQNRVQSPRQIPKLSPESQSLASHHPVGMMNHSPSMMCIPPMPNQNHVNLSPYKYPEASSAGFSQAGPMPSMLPSTTPMNAQNLATLQAQFRMSLGSGNMAGGSTGFASIPPELLIMSQRFNAASHKLPPLGPLNLPLNTMPIPSSLPQSQQELLTSVKSHQIGLSPMTQRQTEELLPALKRAQAAGLQNPFSSHPNQFFLDNGMPPHLAHLNIMNHNLPLSSLDGANTSIATPLPGLGPQIGNNYNPHSPLPQQFSSRAGLDYLGQSASQQQHLRSNSILLPGLSPLYASHSSPSIQGPPPTSMYSGAEFNHPLLQASLAQRMASPLMTQFNLTPQQQQLHQSQLEQASRMFAASQGNNYNQRLSPKNQFYPNR